MTFRIASEDLELGSKTIRKGEDICMVLGAANHDPQQFPKPDQLDLIRPVGRHAAFGMGIHFCLGAPLARAEGQIAINTLLKRMPDLQLQTETLEWRPNIALAGLKALPVSF